MPVLSSVYGNVCLVVNGRKLIMLSVCV